MAKPTGGSVSFSAVVFCFLVTTPAGFASADPTTARAIYEETGVQGGLVVHLGCGDGRLTAELRMGDRYLVQGLDQDAACVAETRKLLHSQGLYGSVTANTFDGRHLPYANDIVTLLVASDLGQVAMDEVHRVLAPEGVAYVKSGDVWQKTIHPRPPEIDEWSHFLHDASGNAVANDAQVGPPKRLRWVAEPRWCRSHEIPSSVNAVVTAGGRIFTILDEGPTGVYRGLPQRCTLIARDAANGVLLWKVAMRGWQPEFGTGTGNRWGIHHTIPRRLVAAGDRVYVTLGFLDSPVSVLDAATGEILIDALEGTRGADELLLADGILIVKITNGRSVAATARVGKETLDDTLAGVDVQTGKQLWRKAKTRVVPYALSALDGRVVYHDMDQLVCLNASSGDEVWRTLNRITSTKGGSSTLVISDGVVLFHGHGKPEPSGTATAKKGKNALQLTAYDLADGRLLWKQRGSGSLAGACTQPTDVFVTGEIVWCGSSHQGVDLRTGNVRQTLSLQQLISIAALCGVPHSFRASKAPCYLLTTTTTNPCWKTEPSRLRRWTGCPRGRRRTSIAAADEGSRRAPVTCVNCRPSGSS